MQTFEIDSSQHRDPHSNYYNLQSLPQIQRGAGVIEAENGLSVYFRSKGLLVNLVQIFLSLLLLIYLLIYYWSLKNDFFFDLLCKDADSFYVSFIVFNTIAMMNASNVITAHMLKNSTVLIIIGAICLILQVFRLYILFGLMWRNTYVECLSEGSSDFLIFLTLGSFFCEIYSLFQTFNLMKSAS